jgi:cytochrome c553
MKFLLKAAACLIVLVALPVQAEGDAAAGQSKSAMCAACHGADGNSVVAQWPKLAGQHAQYLERHLELIKSGERAVPEMLGIVATMSEQDLADVSAFFAAQSIKYGIADEALIKLGESIYRAGNAESGVPACMACHGPAGEGNPLAGYPSLAGQHGLYTTSMLNRFRSGETWGEDDANSIIMAGVANELTDAEIAAVASYIQGLHRAQ